MNRESLETLSKDALITLVLAQAEQIAALTRTVAAQSARMAELEAKLDQPPKTPSNSSTPPSKGEKGQRPEKPKKRRKGRPGVTRQLAENPDKVVDAIAEACPNCGHGLTVDDQPNVYAYDHVELPPIKPETTRINRHRGTCPCCRQRFSAPVPSFGSSAIPIRPFPDERCDTLYKGSKTSIKEIFVKLTGFSDGIEFGKLRIIWDRPRIMWPILVVEIKIENLFCR